jgi:hypothetical protein
VGSLSGCRQEENRHLVAFGGSTLKEGSDLEHKRGHEEATFRFQNLPKRFGFATGQDTPKARLGTLVLLPEGPDQAGGVRNRGNSVGAPRSGDAGLFPSVAVV